ncbi:uncharacterized protein LOC133663855 [Entelurus aequoreus]|uniref:uncharacterized protein LOC133663855 n=1 Tax=Entelurus aequoreus TaxID=161455 RepID=UPI002B1E7EF7|nr:uncharacterized protein LOC133663855 [Entelurus aequoreus]
MLNFISLVFILLLKRSCAVTASNAFSTIQVTTGEIKQNIRPEQRTTISFNELNMLAPSTSQPIKADQVDEKINQLWSTTDIKSDGHPATTTSFITFLKRTSSAEVATKVITSTVPLLLRISTQHQDSGQTAVFSTSNIGNKHFSTDSNYKSTTTKYPVPSESNPTKIPLFIRGDTTHFTKETTIIFTTKANKIAPHENFKEAIHGEVLAGLISLALGLMIVGLLVIYVKKHKLQKQKITMNDWAGPTPFVSGGVDCGQETLKSSSQISLTTFLPKKLSKKMSSQPEIMEELDEITLASTFGGID